MHCEDSGLRALNALMRLIGLVSAIVCSDDLVAQSLAEILWSITAI